ncbi:MAG: alanine dehydrogenase [Bacteroidales bacterium]|nr:alanine dehydrogenase [Bacteroidales bacterium]MBN2758815.1 alanine dehydrogenase [Bacteroidales bacterium]
MNEFTQYSLGQQRLFPQEEMLEIKKNKKELFIGIPKEDKKFENRIPLTPQAVKLLSEYGHKIVIETGAGQGARYSDLEYSEAGAIISQNREDVFKASIILKISPFLNGDIELLQSNQTIISAIHLSTQTKEQIIALMKKKVYAIAFEYIKTDFKYHPIVRSMSEIAGKISINIASEILSNQNNGKGVLLGGITGISPAEIVIIGSDTAAEHVVNAALGLGANIKVFDKSISNLRDLQHRIGRQIFTSILQPHALKKALKSAEVVIGSLDIDEQNDDFIVSEEMVKEMKNGSVIIDLNADRVSCFETSKPTNHSKPTFEKHGVIHYCVPNIASRVARTASIALSNILSEDIIRISEQGGVINLLKSDKGLREGVYIFNGILTKEIVGNKFEIISKDINLLMAAF